MEELSKSQLILLALLVSFVVSIATSVTTASLLEQASPKVTQTIQRVIERTVETVIPSENLGQPDIVTQEKTIIVKEEDAITDAISSISPSLVRLYITENAAADDGDENTNADRTSRFRGIAVVSGPGGRIVTSSALVSGDVYDLYEVQLNDNTLITAAVQERRSDVTFLSLVIPVDVIVPPPAVFGEDTALRLGQTVIGIGGGDSTSIDIGIVSNLTVDADGVVVEIKTNIESQTVGMPLMNLFGEVVGFASGANSGSFILSSSIINIEDES